MIKPILTLGLALTLGISTASAKDNLPAEKQQENQNTELRHPEWGDNIIRLNPITALDVGVGPGISYERIFSADKRVSFILPVSLLLQPDDNYYNNYDNTQYFTYLYFTPGLKFYPFGQRRVTYAIGPNLIFGYGGGTGYENHYDPNTGGYYYENIKKNSFLFGVLVNNYANFQISNNFNLGITAGLGVRYLNHEKITNLNHHSVQTVNNPMTVTGQFSFSLGYRF